MSTPYKLRVKVGVHEFEAEGPEDAVEGQFALFLEIARTPPSPRQEAPPGDAGNGNNPRPPAVFNDEMLDRVFKVDQEGQVSLRILPQTNNRDSDGLLVLLYGFSRLADQPDVLAGRLLKAAKISGLSVDQIDRTIAPHLDAVTKGGARVGSRYRLKNNGVTRAEGIIAAMLH